ncbi:hypothetical protein KKH18_12115 [bacterium]|nr:hypothetical protein [bacterium]
MPFSKTINSFHSTILVLFVISVAVVLASGCAPTIQIHSQPIPDIKTKIYPMGGVDWSSISPLKTEVIPFQKEEGPKNQILENFLETQLREALTRIGYEVQECDSCTTARLYYNVETIRLDSGYVLAYGRLNLLGGQKQQTRYAIDTKEWNYASLEPCEWKYLKLSPTKPMYTGRITIEVIDKDNITQLWRGDVEINLETDDIRTTSGWMIRKLLWEFPAIEFRPIRVPEIEKEGIDDFLETFAYNRDFYAPGQPHPLRLDLSALKRTSENKPDSNEIAFSKAELDEAYNDFKKTKEYNDITDPFEGTSRSLINAGFQKYLNDNYPYSPRFHAWLVEHNKIVVPIIDLLHSAPWSVSNDNNKLECCGAYLIGDELDITYVSFEAQQMLTNTIHTSYAEFKSYSYLIRKINILSKEEYCELLSKGLAYRASILGDIDQIHN